jgi:hypothetical protein
MAVVDRVEGAAQQAGPAGQGNGVSVRVQVKILCRDGASARRGWRVAKAFSGL